MVGTDFISRVELWVMLNLDQLIFRVMGHVKFRSARISRQVIFQVGSIWVGWTSIRIDFKSTDFDPISLSCKGSDTVQFGSTWVSSLLSGEPISDVRLGIDSDHSVQVSDLESVLPVLCMISK